MVWRSIANKPWFNNNHPVTYGVVLVVSGIVVAFVAALFNGWLGSDDGPGSEDVAAGISTSETSSTAGVEPRSATTSTTGGVSTTSGTSSTTGAEPTSETTSTTQGASTTITVASGLELPRAPFDCPQEYVIPTSGPAGVTVQADRDGCPEVSGRISVPYDPHDYKLELAAGQRVSVLADSIAPFYISMTVVDPSGEVLFQERSSSLMAYPIEASSGGLFTIEIRGDGDTGGYTFAAFDIN